MAEFCKAALDTKLSGPFGDNAAARCPYCGSTHTEVDTNFNWEPTYDGERRLRECRRCRGRWYNVWVNNLIARVEPENKP